MGHIAVDLRGKTALITGAGSGIGRGLAMGLAQSGARIALVDLAADGLSETAAEIRTAGNGEALPLVADVTDPAAMQTAAERTVDELGGLDFLFANAGVLGPAEYHSITPAEWDQVLDVNVKGVVHTCRAAIPHMMAQRSGRILITASYNGIRAGAHVIPYRVSKAAVIMFARSLAMELAPHGITVNAICPGVTLTPMQLEYGAQTAQEQGISADDYFAARAARIPMQEFTTIDDLVGLARFLVSDSARLITGQAIAADGGVLASS